MSSEQSLSRELAHFAATVALAEIPSSAIDIARLSAFDWATCALAGVDEPVSRAVRGQVLREQGVGESVVIGGGRAPARGAALANGATSHALDFDDTHFLHIGHPSVVVMSATLAMAQRCGSTGADFLAAVIVGMETSVRVGKWLGRGHYDVGFHQTATAGAFGAAAGAGHLLKLTTEQIQQSLGIVSTRASGLKVQFGTMGKPYNAGIAAANGIEAAELAGAGFIARADGLECALGFGQTHHGSADMGALDDLGSDYWFEDVSYKFHACCHGTHAAIEALSSLLDGLGADSQIESVTIRTNPSWLTVCDIAKPQTGLEAKFSYRHLSAMVMAGLNTGDPGSFTDEVCGDDVLISGAEKVQVVGDPSIGDTATNVVVQSVDEVRRSAEFDLQAPMTTIETGDRLGAKSTTLLGSDRSRQLWNAVQKLETAETVSDLVVELEHTTA
ncbi:MAG: MmgE/PrpD family protein [Actinobacteria bacterium]|nr:MmgE/PrpD family protein [Actinomycetota bacterium]